jgi:hypothetical protein
MAAMSVDDPTAGSNPVKMQAEDFAKVMRAALRGDVAGAARNGA